MAFALLIPVSAYTTAHTVLPWDSRYSWQGTHSYDLANGKQWIYVNGPGFGTWFGHIAFKDEFTANRQARIRLEWDYDVKYTLESRAGHAKVSLYFIIDVYDQYGNWQWGAANIPVYGDEITTYGWWWQPPVIKQGDEDGSGYYQSYMYVYSGFKVKIYLYWYGKAGGAVSWGYGVVYGPSGSPTNGKAYAHVHNIYVYYT
jgi:hypothetical protein